MDKLFYLRLSSYFTVVIISCFLFFLSPSTTAAQTQTIDGQTFTKYRPGFFRPKRGLDYNIYFAPLITVDPLGLGGKSTYALTVGSRLTLWESKFEGQSLQGLRIKGLYGAIGYEYYPQQFDNLYGSLWLRIRTFMPIVARMDALYSFGNGKQGVSARFCFGFEIKKVTLLLCGTSYSNSTIKLFGEHPVYDSPYSNAGTIMLIIPVYTHKMKL